MTETFSIYKKSYYIENICCSIDINNIENYLKRIENIEKRYKKEIEVFLIPTNLIFKENQINWSIFISKSRFLDKINISKKMFTEVIMVLSYTNQIKNVSKEWYLKEGRNIYFLTILSNKKINKKDLKEIINNLEIKSKKTKLKPNIKQIIKYYDLKDNKNIEEKIIEKMALSLYK